MISTTVTTLYNGVRNAVIQMTGVSDGSGSEKNVRKIRVKDLGARAIMVRKIIYNIGGGLVKLSWDGLTPSEFAMLTGRDMIDYCRIGGMKNGSDGTGDILLSTSGFGLNSSYTITFELVKKS